MKEGTIELSVLIIIFLGLQAWWIIPIIKTNSLLNKREQSLRDEINQLEKLYKKWIHSLLSLKPNLVLIN